MEETISPRAQKLARQIQRDIGDIFQRDRSYLVPGVMVSVTVVRVSPDLSFAKIYVSVFPFDRHKEVLSRLKENAWSVRKALAAKMRNQIKSIPEIAFYLDDSLEYADSIETALRNL
ncbi:MAG: 30S ribosome-binding factor RbfA [Rikenellaceae bacterium]|nr:30S ribosome-binding factor RbfA [Rikenellaceae bacterium]